MLGDLIQQTEPSEAKAIISGLGTMSFFGISFNADQVSFWAGVMADLGVFAGGVVTVVLGVQSYLNTKRKSPRGNAASPPSDPADRSSSSQ